MEQRKLIRLGNSSYAIALPKEWVEKSGLKKGDNIFIEKNSNGELMVMPSLKSIEELKQININLNEGSERELRREVAAAYVHGYDQFNFLGKKEKEKADSIKEILNGLLSIEIVKDDKEELIAKDFFSIGEVNQENFIRRIDNNIREIYDLVIDAIRKGHLTQKQLKEIEDADNDINRFYLLSSRIMFKGIDNPALLSKLKTTPKNLFNHWWITFNLENIGDDMKSVGKILLNSKLDEKQREKILNLCLKIEKIYTSSIETFYKKDKQLVLKVMAEGKEVWSKCDSLRKSEDVIIVKIVSKLKEIETACYQNAKMTLYSMI